MIDLLFEPTHRLAALVREREVSAVELVDAALAAIDELNPALNAFAYVDAEHARLAAAGIRADDPRPFAGVPIAIKDNTAVEGWPLSFGSDLFTDFVSPHDAYVVRRLRQAGFVPIGKTNLPEFGLLPVTEPRRFGPTRNPWDLSRTSGGSSGGSASAVAAGMVPLAHGNDGGGSLRIPAACCGLIGLKPTRGRVSRGPDQGDDFLVQDGVLTRTVGETAALLDVLAGYELGDANWAPPQAGGFARAARSEPGRLKIAFTTTPPIDVEVAGSAVEAVDRAGRLLSDLGHEVFEVEAPWQGQDLQPLFTQVFTTHGTLVMSLAELAGLEVRDDNVEPLSFELYRQITETDGGSYLRALTLLQRMTREIVACWRDWDMLLTPSLLKPPVRIGDIDACTLEPVGPLSAAGRFMAFTPLVNATGQPAISLPLFEVDGLPLAVQFIGPPAGEAGLLSLAAQLEQAQPWRHRRPELAETTTTGTIV